MVGSLQYFFFWASILSVISNQATVSAPPSDSSCYNLDGRQTTCLTKDTNPNRRYSTVTTYDDQRRLNPKNDFDVNENCKPVYLNMLIRHTNRYPDKIKINKLRTDLPRLKKLILEANEKQKTLLCPEDIQRLRNFTVNILNDSFAMLAAKAGEREAQKLGTLFKKKFHEILGHPYDASRFRFDSSGQERTITTAKFFAKGIFGEKTAETIKDNIDNRTLFFSFECDEHQRKCGQNSDASSERQKFKSGPIMTALIKSVSSRLGVNVSNEEVFSMYNWCRYGYALEINDVWCTAFSNEELKVLEYGEDLKYYWRDGYGSDINRQKSACVIPESLISQFERFLNGEGKEGALIQVTHAEELKNMFTMFELFKDETHLRSDNMCDMINRKWRTTLISNFLTNLSFVLHRCEGHYKILTLHNESPVTIRGCKSPLCDLEDFIKTYKPLSGKCTIKELCCKCCE